MSEQVLSPNEQYCQQVKQLIEMLDSSPQTAPYGCQVQVFLMNHQSYMIAREQWSIINQSNYEIKPRPPVPNMSTDRVVEGYQKMQEFVKSLKILVLSNGITAEQLDIQFYLVISLLQGIQAQIDEDNAAYSEQMSKPFIPPSLIDSKMFQNRSLQSSKMLQNSSLNNGPKLEASIGNQLHIVLESPNDTPMMTPDIEFQNEEEKIEI